MIIEINFTSATYSVAPQQDEDHRQTHRSVNVVHIYEENVTYARIAQEIPKGAIVEDVCDINAKFEVDGDKLLGWLLQHGELK